MRHMYARLSQRDKDLILYCDIKKIENLQKKACILEFIVIYYFGMWALLIKNLKYTRCRIPKVVPQSHVGSDGS